jgi:hypothetical protein
MPELKIERAHTLGLAGAREVAERWREQAEQEWGTVSYTHLRAHETLS